MASVHLKPGRQKALLRHHPWIFSGAISGVHGSIENGETVDVIDSSGTLLARGAYSHYSQIKVRVWTWDVNEIIDETFFRNRIRRAIEFRQQFHSRSSSNAYRLINAESDGLPGLIVDRYGNLLVIQFLSSGPEIWRELIADLLIDETNINQIYERSDVKVRNLEGLPGRKGVMRGTEPSGLIEIVENELHYLVDIKDGHKTGFYLDQCSNRRRLRGLAKNNLVLDCFAYTGGFSISALAGGARHVTAIESSAATLEIAKLNVSLNQLENYNIDWIEGDVFTQLRSFRDQGRNFDMIVLDPPKFAPTASQIQRASRAYKDINLLAFKLLRSGGILVTFSCSGGVNQDLFQKIIASAALDAKVDAQIIEKLQQNYDHPVSLNFPEGAYLKGLIIRIL
ncbi:MAG: class I SAM-dependent methyltransferase [Anaerolineales bacterium]|nr:class I SAM-dependent methyltransferase [Anaerolineales bacterium]